MVGCRGRGGAVIAAIETADGFALSLQRYDYLIRVCTVFARSLFRVFTDAKGFVMFRDDNENAMFNVIATDLPSDT